MDNHIEMVEEMEYLDSNDNISVQDASNITGKTTAWKYLTI